MEKPDHDERQFQDALRPFRRNSAFHAAIGGAVGCGIGMCAHIAMCVILVSGKTLLLGLLPWIGLSCVGQVISSALYVFSGMAIGTLTGLAVGVMGWQRFLLVLPIVLVGIALSVLASRIFSTTVDNRCESQLPYSL